MSQRFPLSGRAAARALIALAAVCCCLGGALAYAASQPRRQEAATTGARPARPRFTKVPKRSTTATRAKFAFVPGTPPAGADLLSHFECKLGSAAWRRCHSPVRLHRLRPGKQRFSVRSVDSQGIHSPSARFSWRVLSTATPAEPSGPSPAGPAPVTGVAFQIDPELSSLPDLYPGMAPQQLPVSLTNPNSEAIQITALEASVDPDSTECPGAANFRLTAAGVSEADPLTVPAGGTVRLPAQGFSAPTIAMLDLPISQDACQGIQLRLEFSGEAHG